VGETCTISATDTANRDVNTSEQVSYSMGVNIVGGSTSTCSIETALGRSYPGEEIDDIDIFDVLVMIDKALGKMNCCEYCMFGDIF